MCLRTKCFKTIVHKFFEIAGEIYQASVYCIFCGQKKTLEGMTLLQRFLMKLKLIEHFLNRFIFSVKPLFILYDMYITTIF